MGGLRVQNQHTRQRYHCGDIAPCDITKSPVPSTVCGSAHLKKNSSEISEGWTLFLYMGSSY